MARSTTELTDAERRFLGDRHLATLTTIRPDGSPHVVAIAFGYDTETGVVRIITSDNTQKVRNVEREPRAAVSQVDGPSWLTLEGRARVTRDPADVAHAVSVFESRYRPAGDNPNRVAIEILVDRVMGRVSGN